MSNNNTCDNIVIFGRLSMTQERYASVKETFFRRFVIVEKKKKFQYPVGEAIYSMRMSLGF